MVTLETPPKKAQRSVARPADDRHLVEKFARSGYFLGAVLLHLLVFLVVATWVVIKPTPAPNTDFLPAPLALPPPPPPPSSSTQTMPVPTQIVSASPLIETPNSPVRINILPPFVAPIPGLHSHFPKPKQLPPANSEGPDVTKLWQLDSGMHRDYDNVARTLDDRHNVAVRFPVYLASYADGDWSSGTELDNGAIHAGGLPDLLAKVYEWSHGHIEATMEPTPLDIGSPELLAKMPPFIFFTGHKDFHLTPTEVDNLAKYLQNGGAIWGDNALAGKGSRFDVAFKREMRRVIPDVDKDFEDVPLTHDLYTKSWFNLTKVPEGMNYFAEPLQHIDIGGKVAILYTPNDYTDLYNLRILPGDETVAPTWLIPGSPLHSSERLTEGSRIFYRNFSLPASLQAHRLGMNIITFFLIRFDDELLLSR